MNVTRYLLAAWAAFLLCHGAGAAEPPLRLLAGPHELLLSPRTGAVLELRNAGAARPLLQSGEVGLWQLRFQDGKVLSASDFQTGGPERRFAWRREGEALLLRYEGPEASVEVRVAGGEEGFDFLGQVTAGRQTATELVLPAQLQFDPARLERFVSPLHPHLGVGAAFRREFFQPQPYSRPSAWKGETAGPAAYRRLFGEGLDMRDLQEAGVNVQVTAQGRLWLGESLAGKLATPRVRVSRPSRRSQVDLVLLDSANGPVLAASRLGGAGGLWRFGGQFEERDQVLAVAAGSAWARKLAGEAGARRRLGLVSLVNGPNQGPGANGSVAQWRDALQTLAGELRLEFVELRRAEAMVDAMAAADGFLALVNPYGEWLPVPEKGSLPEVVDAIGAYVRNGGHWLELGGYSFYAAMRPSRFLRYESSYPPVFADFLHLDGADGSASLYRIQPRAWEPWSGARNPEHLFVPGRLAFAGGEKGGWCERAFGMFVLPGKTWTAPVVRLAPGRSAEEDLAEYCRRNGVARPLKDKLAPPLLEKLRQSVLVKYNGKVRDKLAHLDRLPVPSLVHYSDYLKGGFDKEYPDHLPPHPEFGTPEEFRAFHDRARALGHLLMPYTNPTWWCDHPRGPSFLQAGEAPLLRNLDGQPVREQYGSNDGWTICFWHPAVREANLRTQRQFTEEYPVDILFQDQCGARGWRYDLNPASPTPFAYAEGLLSLVDEQSRSIPLSTEDGWDRVVNAEVQLCGFTFALGPGRRVAWAREMKAEYHPSTWELYPFVQRVAHDKALLLHHDLGKFVTDRPTLSWTLGLGFSMSYVVSAPALAESRHQEWLRWLDRVQKSVCARYLGEGVVSFRHQQGSEAPGDDGAIHAQYGPVSLACNLSPKPLAAAGRELAGYGFRAEAPGLLAANLQSLGGLRFGEDGLSFVAERKGETAELWLFAGAGEEVAVELPGPGGAGAVLLTLEGDGQLPAEMAGGALRFRLPAPEKQGAGAKRLWHATVGKSKGESHDAR